jgi:hypothetical protein
MSGAPVGVSPGVLDPPHRRHHGRAHAQCAGLEGRENRMVLVAARRRQLGQRVQLGVRQMTVRKLPLDRFEGVSSTAPLGRDSSSPVENHARHRRSHRQYRVPRQGECGDARFA